MAEHSEEQDRTEEPTQRRLEKAIERGDVARSLEVNTWFVFGGMALALIVLSGPVASQLALSLKAFLMNAHQVAPDAGGFRYVTKWALVTTLMALALPLGMFVMAALGGSLVQHAPLWTFEPLMPQLQRISPMSGFKRIFGREALAQFVKGLVKIGAVGTCLAVAIWGERDRLEMAAQLDPVALLPLARDLTLKLFVSVLAVLAFLAVGDYLYQRVTWLRRQRMSKRELKEEFKETEGSPEIKSRLRQIRTARAKRRLMAKVPKATVVIMNPTHYAVALQYEAGMAAPVCVAKGLDELALRIRAIAEEHDVPIVENPPLARALHAAVEVDEEIPVEQYKAVAGVIGYVLRLRGRLP
jgi:flagellar biosynthesis protein FlhB